MSTLALVGTVPIRIAPGKDFPLEVYNNGTSGTVYVYRNPGVSPTVYDYALGPNGKATVQPGVELYLCTDPNTTANAFYHSDGTAVDLGQVSLSGAVALASNPILIGTITLPIPAGSTAGSTIVNVIDVSGYTTVLVAMDKPSTGATIGQVDYFAGLLAFSNDPSATLNKYISGLRQWAWSYQATDGFGAIATFQTPIKDRFMQIAFSYTRTGTNIGADTVTFKVFGIGTLLNEEYVNATKASSDNNLIFGGGFMQQVVGPQTVIVNIGSISGDMYASVLAGGAGGQSMLAIAYFFGTPISIMIAVQGAPNAPTAFAIPYFPLQLQLFAPSGSTGSFSIVRKK